MAEEKQEAKAEKPKAAKPNYVYAALLLHSAGKKIDEAGLKKVVESAGIKSDDAMLKALVSSLDGVDIEEAIKASAVAAAAPVAAAPAASEAKKDDKKDEEEDKKKAEEAVAGLGSLFG